LTKNEGAKKFGLWRDLARLFHAASTVLPDHVTFGFVWGDGPVAWNELGPPREIFDPQPPGTVAWAEEHPVPSRIRIEERDESIFVHNHELLRSVCALSSFQIENHVLRAGFHNRASLEGTQILALSQTKIDGCHVDILFPTPYWVSGIRYPSSRLRLTPRKALPVVWRGSTTGGGISRNETWQEVSFWWILKN
jgi:hypothetical protein